MYEQTLYKVIDDYIKPHTVAKMNKAKKWEYGYNEDYDIVVISKTGEIGEIYEIQNLKIALPKANNVKKFEGNKWQYTEYPKELKKIKSVFDWEEYPVDFKEKWYDYIDSEFNKREQGFWFYNKSVATYVTGSHYMYLQWSKIDVGQPDFRESNRLFFIFWEACKADPRSYGMCYLKNRRSGFSFMSSAETVNVATITSDARYGILSKSGPDAKKMFTDKVVPISVNYPFFFKPIQDGMDRPKTELAYRVPATKYTRKKLETNEKLQELDGLDTTIDWKNTGDNSYDGEKLKLLVHDESGKWFDRGFHNDANEKMLSTIVDDVCVLPRHPGQYAERLKTGTVKFHQTRLRHSGVESAIGAMQRGNGLKRCRDRSEVGFERYFGLAVLGRNIHTLGKLLLAKHHSETASAETKRQAA